MIEQAKEFALPAALGLWALKELYASWKGKDREKSETLKANTDAVQMLTLAITELKVELRNLKESIQPMPKLIRDMDVAHEKLRRIEKEIDQ